MADIARLAGQSRATVGNWKLRNPDFPRERGRSGRGPLYDRAEVVEWLRSTNRLDERPGHLRLVGDLIESLRSGGWAPDEAVSYVLVLLGLKAKSATLDWRRIVEDLYRDRGADLRSRAQGVFPFIDDVLPRRELSGGACVRVIDLIERIDAHETTLLAESLLEQAAETMGNGVGEHFTPSSVRRLVVGLAEPAGSVYNPASGLGHLLIDAAAGADSLVGQEINHRVWALAQLNLAIHGVDAEIALGDVFHGHQFPALRADCVIAVPPWSVRLRDVHHLDADPRWVWGEPGPNDSNVAWIQHCLHHLADGGRAVLVLPRSALFEGGRAGQIRQRIVKAGLLDAVLALPPGLFPSTSVACAVLVFVKGRRFVDGKPAPTLMMELAEGTKGRNVRSSAVNDRTIEEAVQRYREWVTGKHPNSAGVAVASFDHLAANDFAIDPGRYLSLGHVHADLEEAASRRAALLDRLQRLTHQSRAADELLRELLEERR